MERQRLSLAETEKINDALHLKMEELDRLLSQAGQAVSRFVNYPAYVAAAGKSDLSVQRFELLRMEPQSLIAVLMLSDQRVRSQLLHLQLPVEAEQLPPVTKLLNESFTGVSGKEMNLRLMALSDAVPPALFLLLNQIVSYGAEQLEELGQKTFVTAGTRELLKLPEFRDADKAHELMSFLSDSTEKLPVPDDGSPMKILIGPENVSDALHDTSVVVASYDIGDNMRGLIGVVGPTRMDYAAVAARLSGFAEGLTRMFGKNGLPPKEEQ